MGLESTALPVLVISIAIITAFWLGQTSGLLDETGNPTGGLFGTAVATMGMLSTAAYVLTMDMFGPIADNAGGIVEMSQQVYIFNKLMNRISCIDLTCASNFLFIGLLKIMNLQFILFVERSNDASIEHLKFLVYCIKTL